MNPSETLSAAAQYGPSIWFAVFVILTIISCAVAYMKWVGIPARLATEENNRKLTECVAQLATVAARTDKTTTEIHGTVNEAQVVLNAIVSAKVSELDAIAKVAKKTGVDVQKEISEATGLMRFVRQEVVSKDVTI
jgi:hypothetical protein